MRWNPVATNKSFDFQNPQYTKKVILNKKMLFKS